MPYVIAGLFKDQAAAEVAVRELQALGFGEEISFVTTGEDDDTSETGAEESAKDDTVRKRTVAGAVTGGLLGLIAGLSTLVLPGIGPLVIAGPLVVSWGLAGGAIGALSGGLAKAFTQAGFPEERARLYESRIRGGEVLVSVIADYENEAQVLRTILKHGAEETVTFQVKEGGE